MRRELGGWPIRDGAFWAIFKKTIDKNQKKVYYKYMNNYSYVQK